MDVLAIFVVADGVGTGDVHAYLADVVFGVGVVFVFDAHAARSCGIWAPSSSSARLFRVMTISVEKT